MLNMAEVNEAVRLLLTNDDTANGYIISRSEYINADADKCPWVGIYRGPSKYDPRTLGSNRSGKKWRAVNVVRLQVQAASGVSGVQAEERLEEYISIIMPILLSNPSLSGTVSTITGYEISYSFNETVSKSMYFHMATIDISVEART